MVHAFSKQQNKSLPWTECNAIQIHGNTSRRKSFGIIFVCIPVKTVFFLVFNHTLVQPPLNKYLKLNEKFTCCMYSYERLSKYQNYSNYSWQKTGSLAVLLILLNICHTLIRLWIVDWILAFGRILFHDSRCNLLNPIVFILPLQISEAFKSVSVLNIKKKFKSIKI